MRELQTSAARVLHLERATEQGLDTLRQGFGYHPLDLESVFQPVVESRFTSFGSYAYLTLLWPDPIGGDGDEIRLFVDAQRLVIIGDTGQHTVRNFVEELRTLANPAAQHSAPELVHDLIRLLTAPLSHVSDDRTLVVSHRLTAVSVTVRQFGRWLQTNQLPTAVPLLILDAHHLDSLADRFRVPVPASVLPPAPMTAVPQLLGVYALASVVTIVLVLVTLGIRAHA